MKRVVAMIIAVVLVVSSVFVTQDVSAKRMTKRGVYLKAEKKISLKVTSKKIVIKGPLKYGKKLSLNQIKYKKLGKGKKTFKLSKKLKYYVSATYYSRRSKKEGESILKEEAKYSGSIYIYMFMKGKKIYKIVFAQ